MIYLYLDKNNLKLFSLNKTLLGQHNVSYFQKRHQSDLLENGQVKNVDLLASALKEALTLASPHEVKDKDVYLILSQDSFLFQRYNVPSDISETAILPFIKDKVRVDLSLDIGELFYDYLLVSQENETSVLFFAQQKEVLQKYKDTLRLLGLSLKAVIPETLAYFQLFEKTLRKEKKENILYVCYETSNSFGYLYDSSGLLKKNKYILEPDIEASLKTKIEEMEKENIKINRVILSGKDSEKIRQDLFTKNVGGWTNLLKKIIPDFYQDYLKLIIIPEQNKFSFLDFDTCFGGFIFHRQHESFSVVKAIQKRTEISSKRKIFSIPQFNLPIKLFRKRDILIFILFFVISFAAIFLVTKFSGTLKFDLKTKPVSKLISPTPPPPTLTPTPSFSKETLKIKILNGVGIKGKATEIKDILKEKEYQEILTDNADNFDYEQTEVQIKEEKKQAFNYLKDDLKEYVSLKKSSSLPKDSSADVILIIGKDFK